MNANKNMWMVRAGEGGYLFEEFKNKNAVAIGCNKVGDLSKATSLEKIKELYRAAYPEDTDGEVASWSGKLHLFKDELHKGDYVVTNNRERRVFLVGEVTGDYTLNTQLMEYYHTRSVRWREKEVDRDALSSSILLSLDRRSTIFKVDAEAQAEILKTLVSDKDVPEKNQEEDVDRDTIKDDFVNQAQESIKDKVVKLNWEEMQELVAGLLRAMGYKTMVSPKGPDLGCDIQASPDGLGLEDPRVRVQVKHRSAQVSADEVRSFITVTGAGHGAKGLYVSTAGFSRDAKSEAERSQTSVTLVDIDRLVNLLIQYYDQLDSDTRALIPLVKIYWPA